MTKLSKLGAIAGLAGVLILGGVAAIQARNGRGAGKGQGPSGASVSACDAAGLTCSESTESCDLNATSGCGDAGACDKTTVRGCGDMGSCDNGSQGPRCQRGKGHGKGGSGGCGERSGLGCAETSGFDCDSIPSQNDCGSARSAGCGV